MHLGNGIICPVTGLPMLALAGVSAFFAFKKAKNSFTKNKIAPTIALTAFVFALQMINFAIPATGSSGHIIGGVLLCALLGPYAAFLAMSTILIVQAVFFADGGLLALGCNIFNMGFLACFAAYPLIFKPLEDKNMPVLGALLASVAALQLGSIAVAAESALSGSIQSSSILNFTGLMQAIHLPIGIVEGIVTAFVIAVANRVKNPALVFGTLSIVLAGIISNYASSKPDGLEWSLLNIGDFVVLQTHNSLYAISETLQAKSAMLLNLAPTLANITGLIILTALMYLVCSTMSRKQESAQ